MAKRHQAKAVVAAFPQRASWGAALAVLLLGGVLALAPVLSAGAHGQTVLPPPARDPQADARQDQIQDLNRQLAQATAQNEDLQRQLRDARAEISRLQGIVSDLTAANANTVQNPATPPQGGAALAPSTAPSAASGRSSSALNPAQVAATGTLGSMLQSQAPPPPSSGDAYSNARSLLDGGHYAEAEAAFTDFLHNFASSREAPEARYWLGYTLLARNNFTDAAQTFVDYLRRTPNGPNAPAAQVNLGMALAGMNQKPQACAAFADVPHRYPHAAPAVRARAQRESRALNCAA